MPTKKIKLGYKDLIIVSIPASLGVLVEPLAGIVDSAMVGQISSVWLAGLAMTNTVFNSFVWIFNFLVYGVAARIAHSEGSGNRDQVGVQIKMAIVVASVSGLFAMGLVFLFRDFILIHIMNADEETLATITPYYNVRAVGLPFVVLMTAMTGVFRGLRHITLSFMLLAIVTITNAAITYYLLYIEKSDLVGAGVGTSVSFFLGCALSFGVLFYHREAWGLFSKVKIKFNDLLSFGKDSINILGRTGSLLLALFLSTAAVSHLGVTSLAAHQVVLQYWLIASFLVDGFAVTASAYGGNFLGRKDYASFHKMGRRLLVLGGYFGCFFMVLFWLGDFYLFRIFTNDLLVIERISWFWWVVVLSQIPNALIFVYDGILFGSKDFAFLRSRMTEGLLFVCLPILAYEHFVYPSIRLVWLAMAGLYIYRFITSAYFFHVVKKRELGLS